MEHKLTTIFILSTIPEFLLGFGMVLGFLYIVLLYKLKQSKLNRNDKI